MSFDKWKSTPFCELYSEPSRNGLTKPKSVRGSGIRFLNMGELFSYNKIGCQRMDLAPITDSEREKFLLKNGDLLFARQSLVREGVGKCSLITSHDDEMTYDSHIIRVRINKNIANPSFYYYYFVSTMGKNLMQTITEQVAAAGIRSSDLAKLHVPLPSLREQNDIVRILVSLDDKIEVNNQINKTLESMAQALFKYWFIDFEFPNENGDPYKSSGGEMIESELGLIPKGWEVIEFRELFKFIKGKKPNLIEINEFENSKKYLTIDVLNRNSILFCSSEKMIEANDNDVLMVMDGASSGAVYFGQKGIVASTLAKLDLINKKISNQFLFYLINFFESDIKAHTTGSAIPHTDKEFAYRIKIALPKDAVLQKSADKIFREISDTFISREQENALLKTIRDTLLPKLMSGEIRVPIQEN